MHFLIWETLSFNLMYVAACYPVGTTISKTSPLFNALLQHYIEQIYRNMCLLICIFFVIAYIRVKIYYFIISA